MLLVSAQRYSFILLLILVFSTSGWAVSSDNDKISVTATKIRLPYQAKSGLTAKTQTQAYVDALITLGKSISLKEVDSLPRAPGSQLEVIKRNNKVHIPIPRDIADLLIDNGIEVTVLSEFILVTNPSSHDNALGPIQTVFDEACSDTNVEGSDTNDLPIPEGSWAFSVISVTDAPVGAQVLCVDVHFEIDHSCVGDVEVDLTDEDNLIAVDLKDFFFEFPCSDFYEDTIMGITDFAGEPVNQDWLLWATDWFPFDTGVIDSWWIKIYYTTTGVDPNFGQEEPCSETSVEKATPTDLVIPEGYWDYSSITITEAPAEARVVCLDVYFEIDHNCVGDVEVDLSNHDVSIEADLKEVSFNPNCLDYFEDTVTGITDFVGEPVNQNWLLWAVDWFPMDTGVIDSWWIKIYYTTDSEEPNSVPHDEPHQAIALFESELYTGTTRGATGDDVSQCSQNDTQDVWHTFSPNRGGLLVLSTQGSEMDTTVSVYDPCSLSELACGDDVGYLCEDSNNLLWSQVMMPVTGGDHYLIRVAGFNGREGNYQILAELYLDELPAEPDQPLPQGGQVDASTNIRLQWNGAITTSAPESTSAMSGSINHTLSVITPETIYGNDNRVEEYEVVAPNQLSAGQAAVLITNKEDLTYDPNQDTYDFNHLETLLEWYTTNVGVILCPDERFRDQPSSGYCSGFLVAPDIVATAGHCVSCPNDCNEMAFVFGFTMTDETTPKTSFNKDEVYFCQEVIGFLFGWPDWALVRLDRPVVNIEPVPTRRFEKVPDDQPLMMVGHPLGLPKKYDMGGIVVENEQPVHFGANVDASGGNSGSAVFNLDTLEVEGILVAGFGDFDFGEKCDRSLVLPDNFPLTELITRATTFSPLIPSYDIYLGTEPDQPVRMAEHVVTPYLAVSDLQADTTYYWCVIAGEIKSPVWTFTTKP